MRFCCSLFFCRFFQAQKQRRMFSLACLLTEWKSLRLILPPETITMNRRQINGNPPSPSLRKSLSNKDDGCFVGCFGSCWCTPFSNTSIDDHLLPLFAFYSISVGPTSSAAASDRYHRQKTEGSSFPEDGESFAVGFFTILLMMMMMVLLLLLH